MIWNFGILTSAQCISKLTQWRRLSSLLGQSERQGHVFVIRKALFGLRFSRKLFGELLFEVLDELGFTPSKAEPQIWMRENDGIYKYVTTFIDDMLAMKDPEAFIEILQGDPYNFKFKGTSEVDFHLGTDFGQNLYGTLYMSPRRYIERIGETYTRLFEEDPLKAYISSPLEENDHPELDKSDILDEEGTQQYQSLIRQMQWAVSIGQFDFTTAIMTKSSFRVIPRIEHL